MNWECSPGVKVVSHGTTGKRAAKKSAPASFSLELAAGLLRIIVEEIMKPLTGFVKKCCIIAENAKYPALELYLTYVNWCLNAGAPVHDQFSFLEMIEKHGFKYSQKKNGTWFRGISVLPPYRVE